MRKLKLAAISFFCVLIFCVIVYAGISDSRDSWQQPEKIMDSVGVKPGMVIGEIGAGEGYLTFKLSRRVGEDGKIYANDIDKKALKKLRERYEREDIHNITTVVGEVADPVFPVDSLDMVIMILVFHDLEKPVKLMKNVKKYLKPGANVVIIERDPEKWGRGRDHFDSKETVLKTVKKADYDLVRLETFPQRDNIFIYSPKSGKITEIKMYTNSAQWYDLLYSFKDYQKETDDIVALLRKAHPKAQTILDVACGTAEHARCLSKLYAVDGIDINDEFVAIAQEKNPNGKYFCADMINFDLNKKYDVILCLFSSIGYVKSFENVVSTLYSFKRRLHADGVILVEPWFVPEAWKSGMVHMLTAESDTCKICRMSAGEREGILSVLNFHYLIGTSAGVQHHYERHELGMFSVQEMTEAFTKAGLSVEFDDKGISGRGLYVARSCHKLD